MLYNSLLVALGGCMGAISRYAVSYWSKTYISSAFPYGTLFVNLAGSFLLGWLIGLPAGNTVYLLCGTGFMGAFTTFSTFKLETLQLGANKRWNLLFVYTGVSYTLGILLAFAGYMTGKGF